MNSNDPEAAAAMARLKGRLRPNDGVPDRPIRRGGSFAEVRPMLHLCWPPEVYVGDAGPGSIYLCMCGTAWRAVGIRRHSDYPGKGVAPTLGPDRWIVWDSNCCYPGAIPQREIMAVDQQAGLYDFRDSTEVIVADLRRVFRYNGWPNADE